MEQMDALFVTRCEIVASSHVSQHPNCFSTTARRQIAGLIEKKEIVFFLNFFLFSRRHCANSTASL